MQPSILSPNNHTAALAVDEMNQIIDLDRYPIHDLDSPRGAALIADCQNSLDQTAASICHGFLRDSAVERLIPEMTGLIETSYRFPGVARDTFPNDDPNAAGDPLAAEVRALKHKNSNNQILNYQIPNSSDLRAMFLWPELCEFIKRVRRVETLFPSACPHLGLTAKVAFEGDTDGWHYDPNDGVVTILLQEADAGGEFQYAPNIRSDTDENYPGIKRLFDDPDGVGQLAEQRPGTLIFFNGRHSMHRVKPVGQTSKPRIVSILSYDARPDQVFGEYYIRRIHGLEQGGPE